MNEPALRHRSPRSLQLTVAGLLAVALAAPSPAAEGWESGEPIPIASGTMPGKLAVGLSTDPLGQAAGAGGAEPSIFTVAGSFSESPGLYRYRAVERAPDGGPIFGEPERIALPKRKGAPPPGAVFQTADGVVHGFFLGGKGVTRLRLDESGKAMVESPAGPLTLEGLPGKAKRLGVKQNRDGSITLLVGSVDDTPQRPEDPGVKNWRDPNYRPFDGAGVYRGGWPYVSLYAFDLASPDAPSAGSARLASATEQEALLDYGAIAAVDLGPGHGNDVVTGSWFGNLLYYHDVSDGANTQPHRLVVDEDGIAVRSRSIRPSPMAYPNPQTGRRSDLIVGGEGALYYYRFTGEFDDGGAPVYAEPVPVREEGGRLYAGSLPVINTADWDGDGDLDLIAGNSEGRILWFRNEGSNASPAFIDGEEIHTGGRPIHIQPGYNDVQGPQESRWGYVSPTVVDWNGDGLLDIVTSSATAVHEVFLNRGEKGEPELAPSSPIYLRGLELHGTWRVRPAAAELAGRMAYVALDDQDEIHLYWQIDPFNLEDGGKLKLEDGSNIRANFLAAGGTGRSKITLHDWDRDGKTDLIVGTPRHGSVPNPTTGLPQSEGLKGASVLFLKNVGSDARPVFAFPVMFRHRGEPIYVGQHECSAAVWDVGQPDGADLLVGTEGGRVRYYKRSELEWSPVKASASNSKDDAGRAGAAGARK